METKVLETQEAKNTTLPKLIVNLGSGEVVFLFSKEAGIVIHSEIGNLGEERFMDFFDSEGELHYSYDTFHGIVQLRN